MRFLMAANWKMFKTTTEATATLSDLKRLLASRSLDRDVLVCAPYTALNSCSKVLVGDKAILLGGQNCYPAKEGAYTGEISPAMLMDCGCSYVITGHSERRALLGEEDVFIGKKTSFALKEGLQVILCVGETADERDKGKLTEVLTRQLEAGLSEVSDDVSAQSISVAYEPVWAIGTGRVAGSAEILEAHAYIRNFLLRRFVEQGSEIRILYGGSVKPDNASMIISLDNVNGVLVGGASLDAESFAKIVLA